MAWYNASWAKRKAITLTGGASGSISDYQLKLTVTYDSDMKSDFSDLRFTQSDGTTEIDAWMESHTASTSAIVWVEFPTTPANTVEQTYYMYYGNSGAASDWAGGDTFLFFDDFAGNTKETNWQEESGTWSLSSDKYHQTATIPWAKNTISGDQTDTAFRAWADPANDDLMLLSRSDGSGTNCYAVQFSPHNDNLYWYRLPGSALKTTAHSFDAYTSFVAEIRTVGNVVEAWVDGVKIDEYTHTANTIATGRSGFRVYNAYDFDDVRIRKYATNPATYAFGSEETDFIPIIMVI